MSHLSAAGSRPRVRMGRVAQRGVAEVWRKGRFGALMCWAACSLKRLASSAVGGLLALLLRSFCSLAAISSSVHAVMQRAARMHASRRTLRSSQGARVSRVYDSVLVASRCVALVTTVARAELGSSLDPDHDPGCFGYARPHIFHVVYSVLHAGVAQKRRLDLSTAL